MEEFQESDILWPHHHDNYNQHRHHREDSAGRRPEERRRPATSRGSSSSHPISIIRPNLVSRRNMDKSWLGSDDEREDDEEGLEEKRIGILVPPHVLVESRLSEKMAFSVCTGNNGRTLKGRHLSQVRNSVLRMTGSFSLQSRWVPLTKPLPINGQLILQQAHSQSSGRLPLLTIEPNS